MRLTRSLAVLVLLLALAVWTIFATSDAPPVDAVAEVEAESGIGLDSLRVETGGIALHVVAAGPEDGPPVVLLHGLPEFWVAWRGQLAPLARAGFRVLAPDLRGYNASDKPPGLGAYRPEAYEGDILGLLDALGHERAYLAGHDVGAGLAWRLLIFHPERFRKAVVFNANHPQARPSRGDEDRIRWHWTLAQVPYLPEIAARLGNWRLPIETLRRTSRPGTFPDAQLAAYRYAWHRDHAMTTMALGLRAARTWPRELPQPARVVVPTRLVWGVQDAFIPLLDPAPSLALLDAGEVVTLEDAGHWLLHEEPAETARLMVDYFR